MQLKRGKFIKKKREMGDICERSCHEIITGSDDKAVTLFLVLIPEQRLPKEYSGAFPGWGSGGQVAQQVLQPSIY